MPGLVGNLAGLMQVALGLLGVGTVGGGLILGLRRNGPLLTSRLGVAFKIQSMAVRNPRKRRKVPLPGGTVTRDWRKVVDDPRCPIIVELMGGTQTARLAVLAALRSGKSVVTANKALLSAHGEELFEACRKYDANLYYEASVAGGIPIIKVLRESLVGNRVTRLHGIVNGTCNYILTRMKLEGADFAAVLADAQRLGYAEAEPSLDIDGHDAAHKTGILASLAHGFWVRPGEIHVEGIRSVSALDIQYAQQLGYTIKLLGVVKTTGSGRSSGTEDIEVSVGPVLVPNTHVLASVNHVYNAICVRGDVVGDTLYYGRGAGQDATASSVLSDLADAALDLKHGSQRRVPPFVCHARGGRVVPYEEIVSRFYLRLSVIDRPGTLAKIATLLGRARIGISSVIQPEGHEGESVPLIFMIHDAPVKAMRRALKGIAGLSVVKGEPVVFRVEDFS
ncbi:MAG: homoserine dehydrogenase [Verrucomicrobia bacterium]|nr:homoserine dehydrogenase [Verrucomicrobiota bacterium]